MAKGPVLENIRGTLQPQGLGFEGGGIQDAVDLSFPGCAHS
jgi:hypothetical protein